MIKGGMFSILNRNYAGLTGSRFKVQGPKKCFKVSRFQGFNVSMFQSFNS
jgi:UDP-N-acetylglucosamine pyrophosphorylase